MKPNYDVDREARAIRTALAILGAILLVTGWARWAAGQDAPLRPRAPIAPIEPIAAIVDAFKTHPVIGMQAGVGHSDARGFAFIISLLRDPRIQALAVDVAMENGSARYQSGMDRYTRGEQDDAAADDDRHRRHQPALSRDPRNQRHASPRAADPRAPRRSADRMGERPHARGFPEVARAAGLERGRRHSARVARERTPCARGLRLRTPAAAPAGEQLQHGQ